MLYAILIPALAVVAALQIVSAQSEQSPTTNALCRDPEASPYYSNFTKCCTLPPIFPLNHMLECYTIHPEDNSKPFLPDEPSETCAPMCLFKKNGISPDKFNIDSDLFDRYIEHRAKGDIQCHLTKIKDTKCHVAGKLIKKYLKASLDVAMLYVKVSNVVMNVFMGAKKRCMNGKKEQPPPPEIPDHAVYCRTATILYYCIFTTILKDCPLWQKDDVKCDKMLTYLESCLPDYESLIVMKKLT